MSNPRTCRDCGEAKPTSDFYFRDGRPASYCKPCARIRSGAWYRANRAMVLARRREALSVPGARQRKSEYDRARYAADPRAVREYDMRRKYGLDPEGYRAMLEAQGGGCAICHTTTAGGSGDFHVDHDHSCCPGRGSCGKCVRALLCHRCNTGLGLFRDDPELLRGALEYLTVH